MVLLFSLMGRGTKAFTLETSAKEKVGSRRNLGDLLPEGKIWLPNGDSVGGDWAGDKVTSAVFHKGCFDDVPRYC
jgi:hypothetical protein